MNNVLESNFCDILAMYADGVTLSELADELEMTIKDLRSDLEDAGVILSDLY